MQRHVVPCEHHIEYEYEAGLTIVRIAEVWSSPCMRTLATCAHEHARTSLPSSVRGSDVISRAESTLCLHIPRLGPRNSSQALSFTSRLLLFSTSATEFGTYRVQAQVQGRPEHIRPRHVDRELIAAGERAFVGCVCNGRQDPLFYVMPVIS